MLHVTHLETSLPCACVPICYNIDLHNSHRLSHIYKYGCDDIYLVLVQVAYLYYLELITGIYIHKVRHIITTVLAAI